MLKNPRQSTNIFRPGFWLAGSFAASQSEAMLEKFLSKPGPWNVKHCIFPYCQVNIVMMSLEIV